MSKVCWITGAGSGIGRELARQMARDGWTVAISGRRAAALAGTSDGAAEIHSWPLDVTSRTAVNETIAAIEARHGPIDLAILSAAQYQPMDFDDFDAATFAAMMDSNVLGVANCLDPLIKVMRPRAQGQIAIVASVAGYRGLPKAAGYGAGKAALINMAEALRPAAELAGIRLQIINPGFVATPMTERNRFPMPFLIDAEDAATRIRKGLGRSNFEIAFPRRFALLLKIGRLLPYRLYFAVTRRMIGR